MPRKNTRRNFVKNAGALAGGMVASNWAGGAGILSAGRKKSDIRIDLDLHRHDDATQHKLARRQDGAPASVARNTFTAPATGGSGARYWHTPEVTARHEMPVAARRRKRTSLRFGKFTRIRRRRAEVF